MNSCIEYIIFRSFANLQEFSSALILIFFGSVPRAGENGTTTRRSMTAFAMDLHNVPGQISSTILTPTKNASTNASRTLIGMKILLTGHRLLSC